MFPRSKTILAGLFFTLIVLSPVYADVGGSLTVKGRGIVKAAPDAAYIHLFVKGEESTFEESRTKALNSAEAIKNSLQSITKEISSVTVREYRITQDSEIGNVFRDENRVRPQVIEELWIITPPKSDLIIKIIDLAVKSGATLQYDKFAYASEDKGGVFYGLSKSEAFVNEADKIALLNARNEATRISTLAGITLGDSTVSIQCSGAGGCDAKRHDILPEYTSRTSDFVSVERAITVEYKTASK